ncbi:hypothetical protein Taro_002801 [Colocasia esculenta]|uniref:Uncharacterized protein n=1 Tax=Colocasia esculenta TaxID=4460 RepID=A0A843TDS8_COLES|nr:hypothetical protein [Colocasia esculenta]
MPPCTHKQARKLVEHQKCESDSRACADRRSAPVVRAAWGPVAAGRSVAAGRATAVAAVVVSAPAPAGCHGAVVESDVLGSVFATMAAEEQPPPTPQAAPVQPEVPPVVRQQTPVTVAALEDHTVLLERFLRLLPPTFSGDRDLDRAESWVHELECTFETMDYAELDQYTS